MTMCLFSAMIGTFEFKTCNLNFIFLDIKKKKRVETFESEQLDAHSQLPSHHSMILT